MAVQPEQAGGTQVVGGNEGMETAGAALGMPVAIDSPRLAGGSTPPLPVTTSPLTVAPVTMAPMTVAPVTGASGEVLPAGGVLYKVNSSRASFGEPPAGSGCRSRG